MRLVVSRLLDTIPVLLGVLVIAFVLVRLTGDPTLLMLPPDATPEQIEAFRQRMGFDRPLAVQFLDFVLQVLRGDLGDSLRFHQPVSRLIIERLPATLELAAGGVIFAVVVGVPLGVWAAVSRNRILNALVSGFAYLGQATPPFWLGLVMMLYFAAILQWLPSGGRGTFAQLIMPVVTVGMFLVAMIARLTRAGMLETMRRDYIRTARAKGLAERAVIYRHALKNALIPVVTVTGVQFGALLGGAVVTETIFAWPGVGRLLIQAIYNRDFPLVQGVLLVVAAGFVLVNMLVDLTYRLLDPRIRLD